MGFAIMVIKPNGTDLSIDLNEIDKTVADIINEKNKLIETIKEFTQIIQVETPNEMMEKSIGILGLTPEMIGMTTTCHEDDKYIYQLLHVNKNTDDFNCLGTMLAYEKVKIHGNCVLICSEYKPKNKFVTANVSYQNVLNVLNERIVHCGIHVKSDSSYEQQQFTIDPIECCKQIFDNKEQYYLFSAIFFDFVFVVVYDKNCDDMSLQNDLASKLFDHQINGDCFIYIRNGDNDYVNLTIEMFEKIKLCVSNNMIGEGKMKHQFVIENYLELNQEYDKIRTNKISSNDINNKCI